MLTESPAGNGEIVDAQVLERTVGWFREAGIALPTFAQLADPDHDPGRPSRPGSPAIGPDDAAPAQPLPRPLVQRRGRAPGSSTVPEHVVLPRELTGVDARIVVALGDRFPMIERAQGAGRLRLPRAAPRHRPVRPDAQPRRLAVDRQLLPRRRRHLAAHGLPRRRRAAGGDEPGALRLARATGSSTRRTSSARRAPRATSRRSTTSATSSPRIPRTSSSTSSPSSGTTSSTTSPPARARTRLRVAAARRARRCGCARSSPRPARPARSPPATTSRSATAR